MYQQLQEHNKQPIKTNTITPKIRERAAWQTGRWIERQADKKLLSIVSVTPIPSIGVHMMQEEMN